MTRKIPLKKKPSEFSHTPFGVLKGLTPSPLSENKPPAQTPVPPDLSSVDEDSLFRQAMSGVRLREQAGGHHAGKKTPRRDTPQEEEDRELFLRAMQGIPSIVMDRKETAPSELRSSPNRRRQLKRGEVTIAAELDLHGYLRDEALFRLDHFISSAAAKGFPAVLVITGKGVNSPDGPVLQRAVAHWLREQGKG
ncbi:MAG TPA: Smr/MutS family protein, partial [Nitrospirota bacterium]|nr:Smr/MutS family protein [Nitrospirota bacterium]